MKFDTASVNTALDILYGMGTLGVYYFGENIKEWVDPQTFDTSFAYTTAVINLLFVSKILKTHCHSTDNLSDLNGTCKLLGSAAFRTYCYFESKTLLGRFVVPQLIKPPWTIYLGIMGFGVRVGLSLAEERIRES